MYEADFDAVAGNAEKKISFMETNPVGYFVSAAVAGSFIGFGNILTNVIGGQLAGAPATKIVMGGAFSMALSLVVIAGAELFTGNNMVMAAGMMKKKVTLSQTLKFWLTCWLGNLAGSVLLALLFRYSGLFGEATETFLAKGAQAKVAVPFLPLVIRGILCNVLVCLGVWCAGRCKSESGKLIMIFWCIFTFVICGFEHSIANMTQLTLALLAPAGPAITMAGYAYNLLTVTIGNILGGALFVALPYYLAGNRSRQ
ncbi:formate/nitrite transporter family protein [[Clostridium] aminophilum]|uniref:formate/nitrite transporter family protein n=1 Tax=[Clostridium] aminophilum TaxID=1526 RepID=UPI00332A3589